MHTREFGRMCAKISLVTALSGSMVFSTFPVVPAYADLQSDLASAQAKLESIGAEYQKLEDNLTNAAAELEETKGKIEETQNNLSDAQALLASNVSDAYKGGNGQALDVLMGATSFDDLVSRVFYMNKVSDAQTQAIKEVQELKNKLESQEKDQQKKVSSTQSMIDKTAANQKEAQNLVDSLSAEVQAQLEEEAKKNEELAAGMQSAEDGESGTLAESSVQVPSNSSSTSDKASSNNSSASHKDSNKDKPSSSKPNSSKPSSSNNTNKDEDKNTSPSKPSNGGSNGGSSSTGGSTGTSSVGGSALSYALTMEGVPYVFGGASPSGFDCSGLVMWAYAQIGISLPHGASSQAGYIKSHGGRWTTDMSKLQYGDLVFYSGHVAFYVGNGQVFGATRPGQVAGYGNISWYGTFLGGGQL